MVARSHGRELPWKALQYKSSTIYWRRKYCAIKKEDAYGKNRCDGSPATESYRGGTKIERERASEEFKTRIAREIRQFYFSKNIS